MRRKVILYKVNGKVYKTYWRKEKLKKIKILKEAV